jgi:hypothetical protein
MAREVIEFLGGGPAVMEAESADGEEDRVFILEKAYYEFAD